MSLNRNAAARLKELAARSHPGREEEFMAAALRLCAKWRSQQIANTIVARDGLVVQQGLFKGMRYLDGVAEGALSPRLIGSYESELQPFLQAFLEGGLDEVVDIGCAEGYYAVGLARLLPQGVVHAYDIDAAARAKCAELAALNGVADRVRIGERFQGEDFERFAGRRALFIVDIEGAERELLDVERWPALRSLALVVETHPGASPGVTDELIRRFLPSHSVALAFQGAKASPLPEWLRGLGHLDSLLAVWEWRASPTPWLILRPKAVA